MSTESNKSSLKPAHIRPAHREASRHKLAPEYRQGIIDYYSQAGMDYEPWSPGLNMHFGYFIRGLNPFDREQLLDEMSHQVVSRLQLDHARENNILDLGCGVGTSARYAVDRYPDVNVLGITIVPWQVIKAKRLTQGTALSLQLSFEEMDYRNLTLQGNSVDGAYAVESACYDYGKDKRQFLTEAFRVLKPGARITIADGFTKRAEHSKFFNYLYRKVCNGWALEDFAGIDEFVATMREIGYKDIQVEDASRQVAVSVAHVPWVSIKYFFKSVFGKADNDIQMGHFTAPMLGVLMGLHRKDYGYHIISARKPRT